MSNFRENYDKYKEITDGASEDMEYVDIANLALEQATPRVENPTKNSIIVLGFSSNGKSTFVKKFCKENPDYIVVSWDEVARRYVTTKEQMEAISKALEEAISSGRNLILDGYFLNIFTRLAVADTLHSNGYNVNVVDMAPFLEVAQQHRVMDCYSYILNFLAQYNNNCDIVRKLETPFKYSNILRAAKVVIDSHYNGDVMDSLIAREEFYVAAKNNVTEYYKRERETSYIDLQLQHNLIGSGVDKVVLCTEPYSEMIDIPPISKINKKK